MNNGDKINANGKFFFGFSILCVNEVRAFMGLSPIDGGDVHLRPFTKIEDNVINKSDDGNKEITE